MTPIEKNGWRIYFHPLFFKQWQELVNRVKNLQQKLEPEKFITHSDVKLLKGLNVGIQEKIPNDPFASYFALKKPLQKYSRPKKNGITSTISFVFSSV